jgi:maltose phosphorylase
MERKILLDEWKIIEEGLDPTKNRESESLFSLGNGRMGHRGNFEEKYSGPSLKGNYIAGIYYPDKTRVGWWKNGYPEYFAKVLNSVNWIGIDLKINDQEIDIDHLKIISFQRVLDMKNAILTREFEVEMDQGKRVSVKSSRFVSMSDPELGLIEYEVKLLNFDGKIRMIPSLDFDVKNEDSNYDETFWDKVSVDWEGEAGFNIAKTKKTEFLVASAMSWDLDESKINDGPRARKITKPKFLASEIELQIRKGETCCLRKYCSLLSSEYHHKGKIKEEAVKKVLKAKKRGFRQLLNEHSSKWAEIWRDSDIRIEGDIKAQQAIRFNIFHLFQTYTGEDPRLNIGPKGFTGEKYGGSTYWDTEAYCIPFYLGNSDPSIARQLLVYRYNHLSKAIENAKKLGLENGAALYPMVTMNGEECHNEWEITFEEIHRNGAIAYAIHRYIQYSGDRDYLADHGLEVAVGIARFWIQRMNYSEEKNAWVILGVTGPNEYENNVNNNWYTNYMASWCLGFAIQSWDFVKTNHPEKFTVLSNNLGLKREEIQLWGERMGEIYLPRDEEKKVFLQQDGFFDKEIKPVSDIPPEERPINQFWSWDRILRSCYVKQADVLQGLYFFYDEFDPEEIQRNFDFYEPLSVHESSLSPCVHSILASRLGKEKLAYDLFLRTARLDLDDYNLEVAEGLHITSMAGSWMAITEGFGGSYISDDKLNFKPLLPSTWKSLSFNLRFRGRKIKFIDNHEMTQIELLEGEDLEIIIQEKDFKIKKGKIVQHKKS